MFDRFQVNNIVQNRELLRSFNFEIFQHSGKTLLKIEKTSGNTPLVFAVEVVNSSYVCFWNLLKQHYFPCSITILTKIGRALIDNYSNGYEGLLDSYARNRSSSETFFRDSALRNLISRYFRYRNIGFRASLATKFMYLYHRQKANVKVITQNEHILITYFRHLVYSCTYEKEVFEAVAKLFDLVEDTPNSLDNFLRSLNYVNQKLTINSFFTTSDSRPVVYGEALARAAAGETILGGCISWEDLIKSKNNLQETLKPVDIIQPYLRAIQRAEVQAQATRRNVLTEESAAHYNSEVPNVCYWNI